MTMEGSKSIFCSSKFPWARERTSSKWVRALKTVRQPCPKPWQSNTRPGQDVPFGKRPPKYNTYKLQTLHNNSGS
jgi:hypothetical protein